MKKVLLVLLCLLVAIVILFVGVGAALDKSYELSRSILIDAPTDDVHEFAGDLSKWEEWTPWKNHDQSIEVTLGEKTTGVGAKQTWTSEQGNGELTFTSWDEDKGVEYDMAFIAGEDRLPSTGAITYEKIDDMTRVTWSMKGSIDVPILGGWYALTMEPVVGRYFDEGLAKLKEKVEAE